MFQLVQTVVFALVSFFFLPAIDTTQRITVRWFLTGVLAGYIALKPRVEIFNIR